MQIMRCRHFSKAVKKLKHTCLMLAADNARCILLSWHQEKKQLAVEKNFFSTCIWDTIVYDNAEIDACCHSWFYFFAYFYLNILIASIILNKYFATLPVLQLLLLIPITTWASWCVLACSEHTVLGVSTLNSQKK